MSCNKSYDETESYEVTNRKQYTFMIHNKDLACLLTAIVSPLPGDVNVNIVAYSILAISTCKCKVKHSLVKIVVGTDDPNNALRGGDTSTKKLIGDNKVQNKIFRQTLNQMEIKFTVQTVVQVFNSEATTGTSGAFRILYTALICGGINILAVYTGEPALTPDLQDRGILTTFFEMPKEQICTALHILQNFDTSDPDGNLCINVNNVREKCPKLKNKECNCSTCESY